MNWTMGRYIDSLDDEGRDRLVQAEAFTDGAWWDGSCGCLVGTVHAGIPVGDNCGEWRKGWQHAKEAIRYNFAVQRFGKARVVRAIKLRAGASLPSMPSVPAGAREGQEVGA